MAPPLEVPLSKACYDRLQVGHRIGTLKLLALNAAVWGIAIPMMTQAMLGWVTPGLLAAGLLTYVAHGLSGKHRCDKPGCKRMGNAMKAIWWKGREYIFSFGNEEYAELFRHENSSGEQK